MTKPEFILHIGAPKCGSSALQTAFSRSPTVKGADGQTYKYSSVSRVAGRPFDVLFDAEVALKAKTSRYGYASWPNFAPMEDHRPVLDAMTRCRKLGKAKGFTPIMSNEGWISHPDIFASYLKDQGHPPVEVVAFLRPPIDWVNAAFWQWGIWGTPNLDVWLDRSGMNYDFADKLQAWSEIPNVTLHVRRPQPDVVEKFGALFGLDIPAVGSNNATSSAVLIGFLLRNRSYRKDGHDAGTEFVVQRWCDIANVRRPWAVAAHHVHRLRSSTEQTIKTLEAVLPAHELEDLFSDKKWKQEGLYHAAILAGGSPGRDPEELAIFYDALVEGAQAASKAARITPKTAILPRPDDAASIEDWDAALTSVLDTLLYADRLYRSKAQLPRLRGHLRRAFRL